MSNKKTGLGRGLDVLLPMTEEVQDATIRNIEIDDIDPNTAQPRRAFDREAIAQLAQSILEAGVLSPILVVENGVRFRIVAGERRYRAARMAGLTQIPCIVRELSMAQQMEAALIENIQREDLNAIEEAIAIQSLIKECGYTQEETARKLGKSRSVITNTLRLLQLPQAIIALVSERELSAGHARVLAGLEDEKHQLYLAKQCIENGYSVRQLEQIAKLEFQPNNPNKVKPKKMENELTAPLYGLQNAIREAFGVKTKISGNEQKGKVILSYANAEELEQLYDIIGQMLGSRGE